LDFRVEQQYLHRIEAYTSEDYLGDLLRFRETESFQRLLTEIEQAGAWSASDIRMKVGTVRREVVEFLIDSVSPRFVIFDEWHKYKRTCFTNKLLGHFLAQSRASSRTKVLLVSATPFSVEFKEDNQGDGQLEDGGDLEGLLQMVWGKEHYLPHYQRYSMIKPLTSKLSRHT
jgi:hypothetical protein